MKTGNSHFKIFISNHPYNIRMQNDKEILFITGNEDKFREFQEILDSITLQRKKLDLPELQGTPEDIVKEKAKLASQMTNKPCFVDDTSLSFDDWKGLPGPYIKDFLNHMGNSKLTKILITSTNNRKAKAMTSIGYCEPNKEPTCISGVTHGTITMPEGKGGFKNGWDTIFIPNNRNKTYAQMTPEEKNNISQRKKAIRKFEKYLESMEHE